MMSVKEIRDGQIHVNGQTRKQTRDGLKDRHRERWIDG